MLEGSEERWMRDKPRRWSELPKGEYFYHGTPLDRLESIKKNGLITPLISGAGKARGRGVERSSERLFFFLHENFFMSLVHDRNIPPFYSNQEKSPKEVALRVRRSFIRGANLTLSEDPLYDKDECEAVFVKGCVPTTEIEACSQALHNDGKRSRWLTTWIPISEATGATDFPLHIEKIWHPILNRVIDP
jgi:hypothetical protein